MGLLDELRKIKKLVKPAPPPSCRFILYPEGTSEDGLLEARDRMDDQERQTQREIIVEFVL